MDYRWWTLVAVVTALALDLLDITILNVAIPHLMAEFGVGIGDIQWVVTAYLVAMGVVIPATAYLADNFGTKRVSLAGVILLTLPPPLSVCSASPAHWSCWPRMPSNGRTSGGQRGISFMYTAKHSAGKGAPGWK